MVKCLEEIGNMELSLGKKKELVDKYLKTKKMIKIFDIYFENIDNVSMYIFLTYQLKSKTYRVSWIDLTAMENKNVADWFNSNLLFPEQADKFKNIIATNGNCEEFIDKDNIDSKVIMNSYITNYNPKVRTFEFKRYIPRCWAFLRDAILILFKDLPGNCFSFYQIMMEKLVKPEKNFIFYYDGKQNDLDRLFDDNMKESGKILKENGFISYLEKAKDVYYGVVGIEKKYLVEITENKNVKEMQLFCSCGCQDFCQHIYAVLLAIRNKKENRFYKITYKDENVPLLERVENFNYYLCLGIEKDSFVVISRNNIIELPILNKDKEMNWEIIEDDDKKSLEKDLAIYMKEHTK